MNDNLSSQEAGRLPRRRYTPQEIQAYLAAQAASGQSVAAFCQAQALHPSVFYAWKRKHAGGPTTPPLPQFQELSLGALAPAAWVAELTLPAGPVLRLSRAAEPAWVGQLWRQLTTA